MLPIRMILHPTDFSQHSQNAFRLACALARDYGAELCLVYVLPPPIVVYGNGIVPPLPDDRDQQEERLRELRQQAAELHVHITMAEGDPVTEILRVARETQSNLVVMGTHGWTGLSRLLMGSVAEGVVRKAPCPVLTVKTPFPDAIPEQTSRELQTTM